MYCDECDIVKIFYKIDVILKKKVFMVFIALCMIFSLNGLTAFADELDAMQEPVIIGEYDGFLSECLDCDSELHGTSPVNIWVRSYATYDKNNGIQVYVKLYVPWYEVPKPEFTSMSGIVKVDLNSRVTRTTFTEVASGDSTIDSDVDTGRTGETGDKGRINVFGVATANNAIANGGGFKISYSVTIP